MESVVVDYLSFLMRAAGSEEEVQRIPWMGGRGGIVPPDPFFYFIALYDECKHTYVGVSI